LPLSCKGFVRWASDTAFIVVGIFFAALGIKGFLLSSHFIDGGVTGVSMLLSTTLGLPLPLLIVIINLPFMMFGLSQMGKRFALKSLVAIAGLALALAWLQFPAITPDKLLTAVFGGFFLGAGIGLAMRGGAVLDGTDIAALVISRSTSILKVSDVILLLNIFIFSVAAFFLGIESALYSILTYLAASRMIHFIIHGIEEYNAMIIISEENQAIRESLLMNLRRGVTVYKGQGGLSGVEQDILYCVVTRLEIGTVKQAVKEVDAHAFIIVHPLSDVEGGIIKKARLQ
jgi:uncharacterized membrane-anchored protein YitT (DUF2179 family)